MYDTYSFGSFQLPVRAVVVLALAFIAFLTDCWGGHVETHRAQIRVHDDRTSYTKHGTTHFYVLIVENEAGEYVEVQTEPRYFYTTMDLATITYQQRRTRWTNYTFNHTYPVSDESSKETRRH